MSIPPSSWRPPIPTGREDILVEGFPPYIKEPALECISRIIERHGHIAVNTLMGFQLSMKKDYGYKHTSTVYWSNLVSETDYWSDDEFASFLDFVIFHSERHEACEYLKRDLSQGGSAWDVELLEGQYRLVRRVPDGVHDAVREVLSARDQASVKLQEAWRYAFGTSPDASTSYTRSVVAVEIAVMSVIPEPKSEPTLGNYFSVLEAKEPKWTLILRDNHNAPSSRTLAKMLRLLLRGQEDRHGSADYKEVSLAEARTAVMLAATLVQWFTSGAVQAVDKS